MSWFQSKPKPTSKEMLRQTKRELKKGEKSMDREMRDLEKQEKKLIIEIKQHAAKGDKSSAKIMAKNLVQIRKQKQKMMISKTTMAGIGMQATAMNASATMAGAMKTAGAAMTSMNKAIDPVAMQRMMAQFAGEQEKFSMTQEVMDDAMDSVFEDDDEEIDGVVDQVFTELGLEDAAGLSTVAAGTTQIAEPQASTAMDDDLERRLAALNG